MKKPEQMQTYYKCNLTGCILFLLHYLPFISFNFVKSRSKLSTSASPAVRLASSWMSKSVIASEEINIRSEKTIVFFKTCGWTTRAKQKYLAAVTSPTIVPSCASVLELLSEWLAASVCAPSTGKLEDCRKNRIDRQRISNRKRRLNDWKVTAISTRLRVYTDQSLLRGVRVWIVVSGGNQTSHQTKTLIMSW